MQQLKIRVILGFSRALIRKINSVFLDQIVFFTIFITFAKKCYLLACHVLFTFAYLVINFKLSVEATLGIVKDFQVCCQIFLNYL